MKVRGRLIILMALVNCLKNVRCSFGCADDLGDFSSELKLSFFQLGISHQISASIFMQVLFYPLFGPALLFSNGNVCLK